MPCASRRFTPIWLGLRTTVSAVLRFCSQYIRSALLRKLADLVDDLVRSGLQPGRGSSRVWLLLRQRVTWDMDSDAAQARRATYDGTGRNALAFGVKATHDGSLE
jgi:hypothetical protein